MATHAHTTPAAPARRLPLLPAGRARRRRLPMTPAELRARLEAIVEDALAALDRLDGDPEAEPDFDGEEDNVDCCPAGDDDPRATHGRYHGPGDMDDAEPDADREPEDYRRKADPAVRAARARHAAKPRPKMAGVVWL